jgi:hypothetical protein
MFHDFEVQSFVHIIPELSDEIDDTHFKVWRHCSVSGGSRSAGAALPPRTTTVAMKTPAATAMAGALPTINNQLKAAAAMAMETTTTTTHKT